MTPREFCTSVVRLRGAPFSFDGRPCLDAPYESRARRVVLRCSRQVEKTTMLVNLVLYHAVTRPGVHIVCVFPRQEQSRVFSRSRLLTTLEGSSVLRRALVGAGPRQLQVTNMRLANGSEVYIRAAFHTADAARGLDGDLLVVDEFQDAAAGSLPVLEECLSHSRLRRVLLAGTPKGVENPLEAAFHRSTAGRWLVPCPAGDPDVVLDERALGLEGPVCPRCGAPIDPRRGRWVPTNADSTWGEGFWINHLMVPWVDYLELLERQHTYDPALFRNECLGLPSELGDHVVTRAQLEACCGAEAMARAIGDIPPAYRDKVLAGIDWGGGGTSRTVLAVGYIGNDDVLVVRYLQRFPAQEAPDQIVEAIVERCGRFRVQAVAADGQGNGNVYNNLCSMPLASSWRSTRSATQ